jgi:thiol-disulfide isomerase/thioredoxin
MEFYTNPSTFMHMKMKRIALFGFLLALTTATFAQKPKNNSSGSTKSKSPYTIKGHVEGLHDTVVYLANYFGKQLYYNDTARIDAKGNYEFKGKPFNECGKYAMVFPGPRYFEFIVVEEDIEFWSTADADPTKIKVVKSNTNQKFFDFIRFINDRLKSRQPLDACLADSTKNEEEKKGCRDALDRLNKEVTDYQWDIINKNPDNLLSKYLKMSMDIIIPDPPADLDKDKKQLWSYLYYRKHYWDYTDLQDPRIVRDQQFHRILENYLTKVLPQIPDTMVTEVRLLIDKTIGNTDVFKYVTHQATYQSETSKIMCMDKLFVYMVDTYYNSGKATWMSEKNLKDMKDAADKKRNCLCGSIGPDIILPDSTEKNWVSMHKNRGKYTLLVIWESSCGHCKKEVPKLLDVYHRWKDKGFVVYAVGNDLENEDWKKFIKEKKLDWINVSDTKEIMNNEAATVLISQGKTSLQSLNYRTTWDVNSTPKVYLMDENMKIIAKSISAEQIEEFLAHLIDGKPLDLKNVKNTDYEDEDHPAPKGKGNAKH